MLDDWETRLMFKILFLLCLAITAYEISEIAFAKEDKTLMDLRRVGDIWHAVSPDTLQLAQPAIERHIWQGPLIWDKIVLNLLILPFWFVSFVLAVLFFFPAFRSEPRDASDLTLP